MVRTCAARVSQFLQRLQRQLARIEGLEHRTVDEIVDFVEAEFWACDPLLCLWEEVSLPTGDHVRYRTELPIRPCFCLWRPCRSEVLGLFALIIKAIVVFNRTSTPVRSFYEFLCGSLRHRKLTSDVSQSGALCTPIAFGSCQAPVRVLAAAVVAVVASEIRTKQRSKAGQPTMGSLSTSLAAHFANWVEKNEDIKGMFERFAQLYNDPDETLRKSAAMDPYASLKEHRQTGNPPGNQITSSDQEGHALPNPADTRQTAEYVANPAAQVTIADRFTGWAAAGFILHYEPVKAFASADLRARREQGNIAMRQRLDQLAANKDDGVPEPPPDYQEAEQAKGPTSVTPAMPTSHVEGL
eukprot:g25782.t1